jgi:hypothetical protein
VDGNDDVIEAKAERLGDPGVENLGNHLHLEDSGCRA